MQASQTDKQRDPDPGEREYVGRFAPSPTGHLHFGSLTAAVASYLQAKQHGGRWLVRVEDLDPPREVPGSTESILKSLEDHGLHWDDSVTYQSQRRSDYDQALNHLKHQGLLFPCTCSRKQLADFSIYPGYCREDKFPLSTEHAVRIRCKKCSIEFDDGLQGRIATQLDTSCGDFVILRKDNWVAYQLAVVVDDHLQGITEVVRGSDLLDSTPRQLYLFDCLSWDVPDYIHLPLATNRRGEKLGKSTDAPPLDPKHASNNLFRALKFLCQSPPEDLANNTTMDVLHWGIEHWNLKHLTNFEAKDH